jgi:hypothetical protein|tara:strand:+ start:487 stop:984 length:498 start_codon:yes stop_codon:yes gene_type:complete
MPGLPIFCKVMHYIHWNDSPVIQICTQAGTYSKNPLVIVIPKSHLEPLQSENSRITRFYKDGPKRDNCVVEFDLQHLGPELAKISACGGCEMELTLNKTNEVLGADPIMFGDLAMTVADQVQKRGLVKYVQARTTLPTSAVEMTAFHTRHVEKQAEMLASMHANT